MEKSISILDKDYLQWVKELCGRYRQSQIKASVKVNNIVLQFYWELGKDISDKAIENKYGNGFYAALCRDLKHELPNATGLSERNLRYTKKFYLLYSSKYHFLQQLAAKNECGKLQQLAAKSDYKVIEQSKIGQFMSCFVVIEVKIGAFTFADVGQLGGYVVACNHILRKEGRDNPTIGLLICKEKDRIQAQYALESSSQPIAISEYELEKFYPEKIEGTIPTIEELEAKLGGKESK